MEILLLRLDRIGDFLLGVPAYRALRKHFPKDRLTVVVPSAVAELAQGCPYFDDVYVFDALWLKPQAPALDRWRSALKLVGFLRSKKPGWVLDFRYQNRMDPFVTGLSGAKERAGFKNGFWSFLLSHRAPQPPPFLHQVDRNLLLLKALGVPEDGRDLEMWVSERDKKTAMAFLPSQESLPNVSRVGVHLGAATPSKRWGEDDFVALLHELYALSQEEILLFGGPEDVNFAHEVMDDLKCPVVNLVGKLSLKQMAALIRECKVFVGLDSGPSHLAAACGTPVVSLFSAANEVEVWRPWGGKVKVLTVKPECSPCRSHDCLRKDGYFCMDQISVDQAVDAVKGFLT